MLVVKEHKKLLLNLKEPDRVTGIVPGARTMEIKGRTIVSVPHEQDVVRVLRNIGIRAPSPILSHYDWSGRYQPFEHQRDTAEFATLNPRAYILNDMGCVDSETEYLSPEGWVKISAYSGGAVGQYVPETGAVEFVEPQEYVKLPCHKMVRLRTKYGIDQLLSPEHRVLLSDSVGRSEVVSAEELLRRHDQWVSGVNERKSVGRIGYCKAGIPVTFTAPSGAGLPETNAQIRLQIAVIADGHFPSKTNRVVVRLKRPRKIERMRRLLSDAGVEYKESASTAPGFRVFTFYAPVREKSFGPRWWQATRSQLAVVADEVMHWDGSVSDSKPSSRFSTSVRESADFVQYAFVGTGRVARVSLAVRRGSEEFNVSVRQTGGPLQLASLSSDGDRRPVMEVQDSTDGFKYCFVVPSAFLVFRRNGCVFASGNTGKTVSVLWAFHYLRSIGVLDWAIVVSPLSTLERVWADEVFTHFPELSCGVLHGTPDRRMRIATDNYDVYVINHDGLKNQELCEFLCRKPGNGLVIVDELAVYRNSSTDRWRALNTLVNGDRKRNLPPRTWVWGLTGTPIPNEPTDAWAQCRLIRPDSVPRYFNAFRDMTMRQLTQYKWIARTNALDTVYEVMQPAIRYSREECIDLPPTTYTDRVVPLTREQETLYKQMLARFKAEYEGGQITAANEAVKIGKLLQICCLRYDTHVLTRRGWVEIQHVRSDDLVWDGVEWVAHSGSAFMGVRPVINCGGVQMTPDHLVLSTAGWVTAERFNDGDAGEGFDWPAVRLPDGSTAGGHERVEVRDLGVPVRLRQGSGAGEPVPAHCAPASPEELRLSPRQRAAHDVAFAAPSNLGEYEASVRQPERQGLAQLRRAWRRRVRAVAGVVRELLGRYAARVRGWADARPHRQPRTVLAAELSVGNARAAEQQSAHQRSAGHAPRADDDGPSGARVRVEAGDPVRSAEQVRMAAGEGAAHPVYDLLDCGPRRRFVVRAPDGAVRIVHNCGVAYSEVGDVVIPARPRLDVVLETIEQSSAKVIVFVPLTGALNAVAAAVREHYSVSVVHGGVPKRARDDIFSDFQSPHGARVLVAQPATMAHGLSLTAADTIIWYAPTSSEITQQANARIVRPGQKRNTLIVRLMGSDVERRMYDRLKNRDSTQGVLLDMFK